MSVVGDNLNKIKASLPSGVTLVAVSKYHPNEDILAAYQEGQRIFGENLVQELKAKHESLPKDIEWHLIGHLQKNKVKYIAPFVSLIHSVDSLELLKTIDKYAAQNDRVIPVLLQLHVAEEETKFGLTLEECSALLRESAWKQLAHVSIQGIMGMASNTDCQEQIAAEFSRLRRFFESAKAEYFAECNEFSICSWGMSSDYLLAVQNGSNMVRVGSSIFGARDYSQKH